MTYVRSPDIDLVQSEVVTYLTRKARKTPFKLVDKCGRVVGEVDPIQRSIEILKKAGFIFEHETGRKQTVCAGFEGPCPDKTKPPKFAFTRSAIKFRGGQPWRCSKCAVRKKLSMFADKRPACVVCGAPSSVSSARSFRTCGTSPKCKIHTGLHGKGRVPKPRIPCAICGEPSSSSSSSTSRRLGLMAYCDKHKGGSRKK